MQLVKFHRKDTGEETFIAPSAVAFLDHAVGTDGKPDGTLIMIDKTTIREVSEDLCEVARRINNELRFL